MSELSLVKRFIRKCKKELDVEYRYRYLILNIETGLTCPGVPDIFISFGLYTLWLEAKIFPNSLSPTQIEWWHKANWCTGITGGFIVFKDGKRYFIDKEHYKYVGRRKWQKDITEMNIIEVAAYVYPKGLVPKAKFQTRALTQRNESSLISELAEHRNTG